MHHIDLCSGIGGFSLGFQQAGLSKPVLFCDTDAWCRKVLAKHWPDVPIAEDVKELANDPDRLIPATNPRNTILTAGYPCQSFSVAGKQRGTEDDRHIWPYISQIISRKRPAWCVFENVYGHIALGLDQVLADLEAQGYATRTFIVPACGVNAPHRRDRLWIIAHTNSHGEPDVTRYAEEGQRLVGNTAHNRWDGRAAQAGREGQAHQPDQPRPSVWGEPIRPSEDVADTDSQRGCGGDAQRQDAKDARQSPGCQKHGGWNTESAVGRVAHGIPRRVDRLKGLGNAIVPQIAQRIGETIKKAEGL